MLGINRCDVIKAAVRAMLVIPGVFAIVGKRQAISFACKVPASPTAGGKRLGSLGG